MYQNYKGPRLETARSFRWFVSVDISMIKILHCPMAIDALQIMTSYKRTSQYKRNSMVIKRNMNLQYAIKLKTLMLYELFLLLLYIESAKICMLYFPFVNVCSHFNKWFFFFVVINYTAQWSTCCQLKCFLFCLYVIFLYCPLLCQLKCFLGFFLSLISLFKIKYLLYYTVCCGTFW